MTERLPSPRELMQLHIRALFALDGEGDLVRLNLPRERKTAPGFYCGYAPDGRAAPVFRCDIPHDVREAVRTLIQTDPLFESGGIRPDSIQKYAALLPGGRCLIERCYCAAAMPPDAGRCVTLDEGRIDAFALGELDWLKEEIHLCRPCAAYIADGRVTSVCRSVRITPTAHEAGIETAEAYRGRGYAGLTLAAWANAARAAGVLPLYSASIENTASQRVAAKAGLSPYGVGFSFV